MIWFVYDLAADTDDDSPDSDAELPSTSATSYRGGIRDRKGQKCRKRTGTAI